jgi:hypothetical protein
VRGWQDGWKERVAATMALMPCRECGKQVSTEAVTCPNCGVPNPTGTIAGSGARTAVATKRADPSQSVLRKKHPTKTLLSVLALVVVLYVANTLQEMDKAPSQPAPVAPTAVPAPAPTTSSRFPGIDRVGADRARQLYRDLESTPGLRKWECQETVCWVQFDPALWVQMPYDLKRDAVAGIGIALAAGRSNELTVIRDAYTGIEIASYSATIDRTRIK